MSQYLSSFHETISIDCFTKGLKKEVQFSIFFLKITFYPGTLNNIFRQTTKLLLAKRKDFISFLWGSKKGELPANVQFGRALYIKTMPT